jgi:hypothetical protein
MASAFFLYFSELRVQAKERCQKEKTLCVILTSLQKHSTLIFRKKNKESLHEEKGSG